MKGSPARSRAIPARTRAVAARPVRDEPEAHAPQPARNIPSELAVLLAELARLEGELAAARSRMLELEATADIDTVTGIFNRRGFDRELARSLAYVKRYGTRAALFYIDLDGFKPVNDRHGHAAGDAVLKAIADDADPQCARLRYGRAARRRRIRPDPVEPGRRAMPAPRPGRWKPPSPRPRSTGRASRSRSAPRSALR